MKLRVTNTLKLNHIYNEDCFNTMDKLIKINNKVDLILTSPPYATSTKVANKEKDLNNSACGSHIRYDVYNDDITPDKYLGFIEKLFDYFDKILSENGVVLYNFSYSNKDVNTCKMYYDVLSLICGSKFVIVDCISWKKSNALPIQSHNKISRLCENVFVIARKSELRTFKSNKKMTKQLNNGQKFYEIMYNYIEARNNDGSTNLNKATFSSELVLKLLEMYAGQKDGIVYDPFMGTGTTAYGVKIFNMKHNANLKYLGSELSENQVEFANNRLKECSV